MELFVLTEAGKTVAVFSTREKLTDYIKLMPTKIDWSDSCDGIEQIEVPCDYHAQRFVLDQVKTDA